MVCTLVSGGLVSFRSLLDSQFVHVPYDAVVPGALTVGDVADIVAALAPTTEVTLSGMVDGLNRRVSAKDAEAAFAVARKAYRDAKAGDKLKIE